jgi:GDPmannose 4,6-dehydratase
VIEVNKLTKVALITGINGQDGTYLSEFLLKKGCTVHGIRRGSLQPNIKSQNDIHLHYSDLTEYIELVKIIQEVQPDEIYNLAAQSNVKISFERPEYTTLTNALVTLKILEIIRTLGLEKKTRFFQASTGELFGNSGEIPQKESTPFYPKSPYAVSKLYAYWICVNYREAYDILACNGILFNHESPIRPEKFVTKKSQKLQLELKEAFRTNYTSAT